MRRRGLALVLFIATHACVRDESLGSDGSQVGSDTGSEDASRDGSLRPDGAASVEAPSMPMCTADRLPPHGGACDPALMPAGTFCRLSSCARGGEQECACLDARWRCTLSSRDGYGCGTPPFCRESFGATCDASECPMGMVRIAGTGPWDATRMCWPSAVHDFGCVAGPDAGPAFSCFLRISTNEYFYRGDTQIPAGTDYKSIECPASPFSMRCESDTGTDGG